MNNIFNSASIYFPKSCVTQYCMLQVYVHNFGLGDFIRNVHNTLPPPHSLSKVFILLHIIETSQNRNWYEYPPTRHPCAYACFIVRTDLQAWCKMRILHKFQTTTRIGDQGLRKAARGGTNTYWYRGSYRQYMWSLQHGVSILLFVSYHYHCCSEIVLGNMTIYLGFWDAASKSILRDGEVA